MNHLSCIVAERSGIIVGIKTTVIIDSTDVEVASLGIHLVFIVTSTVSQERTDISIVLESPATSIVGYLDIDALLLEVSFDFLDYCFDFHL